jgi:hypothetical protein
MHKSCATKINSNNSLICGLCNKNSTITIINSKIERS